MTEQFDSSFAVPIPVLFRPAAQSDLAEIVRMLSDDPLGAKREHYSSPLLPAYTHAFQSIESDPNNEIVLAVNQNDDLLGFLQLTYIPNLTYQGRWRAMIEGVRVHAEQRSRGIGQALVEYAIECAQKRGCLMVQLTSDKSRADALRFYTSLGFIATHEGFKLML
jgi:ribosomal protein S18 acetylase RimI-like enzyme